MLKERGALEVIVNGKVKRELKQGDGFGELALLYNAPRSASVKAIEKCQLWGIDRNTFRKAVEEMITKEYEENRKFMEVVRFFCKTFFLPMISYFWKITSQMSKRML